MTTTRKQRPVRATESHASAPPAGIQAHKGAKKLSVDEKPTYRIPTMKEVAKLKGKAGYSVVSTFSGCGGSCLGFEMAGFDILRAHEFIPAAVETYRANHPGVPVCVSDIRKVTAEEILDICDLEVGQLDVLEGSPPCASFSTAGRREKGWGKVHAYSDGEQQADDLFFEFARLVKGVQPKVFVAENVSGLVKGSAKGYFLAILAALKDCGYRVEARLLDAQWLGVPQTRQRLIFIGVRNDLRDQSGEPLQPVFPSPLPFRYTVREAIGGMHGEQRDIHVIHNTSGTFSQGEVTERPCPAVTVGVGGMNSQHYQVWAKDGQAYDPETGQRIDLYGTKLLTEFYLARKGKPHKHFSLMPAFEDKPLNTVTAAGGSRGLAAVTHYEPRKFTLAELRRVCAFPEDFILTGSYNQRWERLGRAVPPLMMRAVANVVRDGILRRIA